MTAFHTKFSGYFKRERRLYMDSLLPLILTSVSIAVFYYMYLVYSPISFAVDSDKSAGFVRMEKDEVLATPPSNEEKCDLFKGRWVPATRENYYTNSSCTVIPDWKNCFKNGRKDSDFLNWKWKPDHCEQPAFDPKTFLHIVHGKKMAFVGDSVARNHLESLLCLLSQEEIPKSIYTDSEDRFRKWYFPQHDFTLILLWSKFLVAGEERMLNGTGSNIFDLHLDKVDYKWAHDLPDYDYLIMSGGHWFNRVMYLHQGGKLHGCVYCRQPNVTDFTFDFPFRMAFRTASEYISSCNSCKKNIVAFLRTFAPAHYENGGWNTGGNCNRTSPVSESEIDFQSFDWHLRNVQVEEFERAKKLFKHGKRIELLDVSRAMLMRPDGHPGDFWRKKYENGYTDCTHWCLPGPVDFWNELLLAVLLDRNSNGG